MEESLRRPILYSSDIREFFYVVDDKCGEWRENFKIIYRNIQCINKLEKWAFCTLSSLTGKYPKSSIKSLHTS